MAKEKNYKVKKNEYHGWYEVSTKADGRQRTFCDVPRVKADGKVETRSECIKRMCKVLGVEYQTEGRCDL